MNLTFKTQTLLRHGLNALVLATLVSLAGQARAAVSGTIITIAGDGSRGFSGDGGPATNAAISEVEAITVGPDGTIYFVDGDNYRIRAIDPVTGHIRTVAGNGIADHTGNGGPATNASISTTTSLATDRARNVLYLSAITHRVVRRLNLADGTISIYAGTGTIGFTGDGGPATSARLRGPWGLATDAAGNLSIAAQFRVRQVNPLTGIINTIAGGDSFDFAPDGFPAVSTSFHGITELAADPAGNVFIFEGFSNEPRFVRRVDVVSGLVSTVAGGGTNAPGTGVATNMEFIGMFDIGVSAAAELFIAMHFELFRVDLATGLIAPIAGNGTQGFGGDGGPALSAQFNTLAALAVIPGGGVVVADMFNYRIRYIAPDAINLTNDNGQTSFALPWVNGLSGDLILQNNPNLTNINFGTITNVGGVVSIGGNTAAGVLDLSSLLSAGTVEISGNTAAGVISLSELGTVAGEVNITGNTSAGVINLGSLQSAGTVEISGNTAAGVISLGELGTVAGEITVTENPAAGVVDLSSLQSSGTVEISGNTAAGVISLGELGTVAGEIIITDNTNASVVDLSSLADASGDVTIESNATDVVVNLSSLTTYGCGTNEVTLTLDGGTVEMTNGLTLCTNATLTGSTTMDGSVTNNGTIEPGSSPGRLNLTGNLHLNSPSRLHLEIGGYGSNQFDVVSVGGNVTLGGNLTVRLLNSFTNGMTNGASFTVLTAGGPLSGSFANVASGGTLITADGRGQFTVRYAGENTVRLTELQLLGQPSASSGTIITIAGNGSIGYSGDGGPATNAALNYSEGLAFGRDGTLYIADSGNFRIRALDPATGVIRTIAGTGVEGDQGNDGPATNATMTSVIGLATDRVRNALYLTDWANNWVRKVNLTDGILTVYAGSGNYGFSGDGGPATAANLLFPIGAAIDGAGRLSFIDLHNDRIRRVDPVTGIITTIAGSGIGAPPSGPTGDGGPATGATFGSALRLTADSAGNVYLRDGDPNGTYFTVRRIDALTGLINTIVGGGTNPPGAGMATNMLFDNIAEVAVNDTGELFVATPHRVFKLNIATGIIAPYAGDGTNGFTGDGGSALNARFASITAMATAPGGGLVVADSSNARIRYVAPDSINLTNDSGQTSFALPWVSGLSGNLVLQNNPNLTNINLAALTSVSGDLVLGGNLSAGTLDLGSLQSAGNVSVSGNTAAGVLDLSSLTTVSGDLVIEGNTSAGILDFGLLNSANNVSVSGNTAAGELDLGSLATVSGNLVIEGNSSAGNLDLGSLAEVSGDLTIQSNAPAGNLDLSSLTEYGCGTNEVTMTLNGSTVEMTNGLTLCTNATLTGSTTVDGSITNNGTIEPGSSPGRLNITRDLHLGSASRLRMEISGYAANQFDLVNVGNGVTLGGTLTVTLLNNFTNAMTNGASFTVLTAGAPLAGSFANVASGGTLLTADGRGLFTVRYAGENTVRLTDLQLLGQPSASSGTIITIAGRAPIGYSGDGGPATNASISGTVAMAFGPDGTLYFADVDNARIRAVDPLTGIIRTVAGNGNLVGQDRDIGDGGQATNASLGAILGLAVDRTRNVLYLSDGGNNRVRKVDLASGIISRFAGRGLFNGYGGGGDGGPAIDASFAETRGIGIGGGGRLLIADQLNGRIRQVNPVTGIITTLAGFGDIFNQPCSDAGNGGPATNAFFGLPTFVSEDAFGNVFVLDGGGTCPTVDFVALRRIDAVTGIITLVAGGGTNIPGNGPATNMNLLGFDAHPAVDDAGDVFLASHRQVFKLSMSTGLLSVFAGDGVAGDQGHGDGGPASEARFASISGLATVPGGGLIIADSGNGRIRYVAPNSINLINDSGQTSFSLPWVNSLTGDFILVNNPNLTNVNAVSLTTVGGVVSIGGNTTAGVVDLGPLESAGSVSITTNPNAVVISLGSLASVTGEVDISGNTSAATVHLGSVTNVGGAISMGGNTAASSVDLSSLRSAGSVSITSNTSATIISMGSITTVAGEVEISGNTGATEIDLGSLSNAGDVTIESNAPSAVVGLSSLTNYGCGTNEVTMTLNGGTVEMTNGLTLCTNATLTGSTTVDGSITNNGTIEPGSSPGRLNITRDLHLGSASRLRMEISGYAANQFDLVNVGNGVTLGGTLTVTLLNNFTNAMTNGASFTVLTAGAPLAGSFANVASGGTLITADGRARFTVRYAGENTLRLTNFEILNSASGDTDGDGMSDLWEDQFGLNKTNSADAELDLDGDGASNLNEFVAGTLPDNASSVFRIVSIEREAAAVRITWSTVGGKSYRVQTNAPTATGGITNNFADFGPIIQMPGTGESTTNLLDTLPAGEARYYRVRVAP